MGSLTNFVAWIVGSAIWHYVWAARVEWIDEHGDRSDQVGAEIAGR